MTVVLSTNIDRVWLWLLLLLFLPGNASTGSSLCVSDRVHSASALNQMRGVSYPPPSPRGLTRAQPVPQSRNPPLVKTRRLTSVGLASSCSINVERETVVVPQPPPHHSVESFNMAAVEQQLGITNHPKMTNSKSLLPFFFRFFYNIKTNLAGGFINGRLSSKKFDDVPFIRRARNACNSA